MRPDLSRRGFGKKQQLNLKKNGKEKNQLQRHQRNVKQRSDEIN